MSQLDEIVGYVSLLESWFGHHLIYYSQYNGCGISGALAFWTADDLLLQVLQSLGLLGEKHGWHIESKQCINPSWWFILHAHFQRLAVGYCQPFAATSFHTAATFSIQMNPMNSTEG